MISYEYTQINRLKSPHGYMYTPYNDIEFIDAYVKDRLNFLNKIKKLGHNDCSNPYETLYAKACALLVDYSKKNIQREDLGEVFNFDYSFEYKGQPVYRTNLSVVSLSSFNSANVINSENLLVSLLDSQVNGGDQQLIGFWLDLLVQKFEVTKKIYEQYPVNFGKGLGRNDSIQIYWKLFLSLSLLFSTTKNIKYLSTMLKVSDLFCSLEEAIVCKNLPTNYFSLVLSVELANIRLLSKNIDEVCLDLT